MKPLIEVDPADVADAVLRMATRRRGTQTVPAPLGAPVRTSRLLPSNIWYRPERFAGLDTAYTHADPAARAVYHNRVV
jgi:hypothetical protein